MSGKISNIIFTKNRPLQLDGYLESLYRFFPKELFETYIIYKPQLFADQYRQVFNKFSNCHVIEEKDFSSDFLRVIETADTEYMLFGVDDVIYFDSVDFEVVEKTFEQFQNEIFGFSLRLDKEGLSSNEDIAEFGIQDQSVYSFDWKCGKCRYPFELCATVYKTGLVKKILTDSRLNNKFFEKIFAPNSRTVEVLSKITRKHKILKTFGYFYNPNTLESWNCRWCQNNTDQLPNKIYFQKQCAVAIQVNMVNTSTNNESDGSAEFTVETLAEKYDQGYRMDIDLVKENKPSERHSGREHFKLIKLANPTNQ